MKTSRHTPKSVKSQILQRNGSTKFNLLNPKHVQELVNRQEALNKMGFSMPFYMKIVLGLVEKFKTRPLGLKASIHFSTLSESKYLVLSKKDCQPLRIRFATHAPKSLNGFDYTMSPVLKGQEHLKVSGEVCISLIRDYLFVKKEEL